MKPAEILVHIPVDRRWRTTREIWQLLPDCHYRKLRDNLRLLKSRGRLEAAHGKWRRTNPAPVYVPKTVKTMPRRYRRRDDGTPPSADNRKPASLPEKRAEAAMRPCLNCGKPFMSKWKGNRLCGCISVAERGMI